MIEGPTTSNKHGGDYEAEREGSSGATGCGREEWIGNPAYAHPLPFLSPSVIHSLLCNLNQSFWLYSNTPPQWNKVSVHRDSYRERMNTEREKSEGEWERTSMRVWKSSQSTRRQGPFILNVRRWRENYACFPPPIHSSLYLPNSLSFYFKQSIICFTPKSVFVKKRSEKSC